MSFFFTAKKKAAPKRGAAPTKPNQAGKANKETLNRLGCRACPLDKAGNCSPKMPPDLAEHTDVYFLGDKPQDIDDEKGLPFSDAAGKTLREIIGRNALGRSSFDNVIRDYDDPKLKNTAPSWVAMEACRNHVVKSIEEVKPKFIVGLGVLPLQWMLNSSDMIGLRGRVFAVQIGKHACWFMPTYHPQFIHDNAFDLKKPLQSKLGHCLKFDVAKALKLARDLDPPVIDSPQAIRAGIQAFDGRQATHLAAVLKLISEARKAPEKAIDLETYPLRPYAADAKLLTCAISFKSTNFSFAIDHSKAGWSPDDKKQIKAALSDLLSDETTIIAHNTPFECEWLIANLGKEVIFHDNWECTMMQSHFIDERRGKRGGNDEQFQPNPYQALDFLVKQYFGISYKSEFKIDRKHMDRADLGETLLYNGADTKYTLRLYKTQRMHLRAMGLQDAYYEAVERQPTVALMQSLGIKLDQKVNAEFQQKLAAELKPIEARIACDTMVKKFEADKHQPFNPASQQDVLKLFKNYYKVGKALLNEEGKETVDKTTLGRIASPIAEDVELYRNRSKLKSTYVDVFEMGKGNFIWPDAHIHPSFNTTFAETGRTSSDEPNQQNWPSRSDKWVRKQVVARKGHVLVAFDYGQLEACTAAMCTKDRVLVKALWEDYDIHMEWAIKAAKRHPAFIGGLHNLDNKDTMKSFRSLIKNKLVFPVFFGAQNSSVAGYLNAPIEPVNKLMDEFWRTFSGVYNWQKRLMGEYYDMGYVESLTGRRRNYPLSKNQAVNYPIQSVACDIVCRAMVALSRMAAETGKWYLHPIMNIHDDLTFSIPDQPQILEEAIETIYRVMLTPVYDFINVPLSVSASVGDNWLEMDEIGKFWSHRDI